MPKLSPPELSARSSGMGSTCIVEANGLAPWSGAGPMRLYCEKLGITLPDDAEEDEDDSDHLEWGHVMEPVIADWYERTRGVTLQLGGPVYSREVPNFWATLDRTVIGASKLVEIKNVGSPSLYRKWDASSPDGVPSYVRAQVTIAMDFHGARECDVAACIGGRPPHVWTVFYDADLARLLLSGGIRFWGLVTARTPPPMDHTPASKIYLRDKYPREEDPIIVDADQDLDTLGSARAELARTAKRAAEEVARHDAEILRRIGLHTGARGNGWRMTWKIDKNGVRRQRFTEREE